MPRVIGSIKVRCHGFHRSKPIFEVLLGLGNGQTKQSTRDIKPPALISVRVQATKTEIGLQCGVDVQSAAFDDDVFSATSLLTDESGDKVRLKLGAEVDVVLEADTNAITKLPDHLRKGGSGSSLG
jgi:hypothetical protein